MVIAVMIRLLAVSATTAVLCVAIPACGGARSSDGASTVRGAVARGNDLDNDNDHGDDDTHVLNYGYAANAADERESTALVKRYYALAAARDGTRACPLLVPLLAETIAEQDSHSPGLRGSTCAVVLSKLFARDHRLLAEKDAHLKVLRVRVKGDKGLILLDFPEIPEARQILERRVNGTWRLREIYDGIIE
jgi:hypothetical protein